MKLLVFVAMITLIAHSVQGLPFGCVDRAKPAGHYKNWPANDFCAYEADRNMIPPSDFRKVSQYVVCDLGEIKESCFVLCQHYDKSYNYGFNTSLETCCCGHVQK